MYSYVSGFSSMKSSALRLEASPESCLIVESSPEVVEESAVVMLVALAFADEYEEEKDNEDSASVSRTYASEKTISYCIC